MASIQGLALLLEFKASLASLSAYRGRLVWSPDTILG